MTFARKLTYPIADALAVVVNLLIEQFKESWRIELKVLNTWLFRRSWSLNKYNTADVR